MAAPKYFIVTESTDTPLGYEAVEAKSREDAINVYRKQCGYGLGDYDNPLTFTVREVGEPTTYNVETTVKLVPVVKKTRAKK